ncbi:MAG: Crp/Fnr family transcriptional regulator [Alphaproteobacteria bacterium]|nr:Crp/Fnr family transcriptional regulator [Alphaproteobacteria bacterium]
MTGPTVAGVHRNRLLDHLSQEDAALIDTHLKPVAIARRTLIEAPQRRIEHVTFIERGIASVVAGGGSAAPVEVGLIGCEGLAGLATLLGESCSPHAIYMQIPGGGQRIAAAVLAEAADRSRTLQKTLLKFVHAFMTQLAYTAVANARATLEQRLARWILMAHDRIEGNDIALTHELLALMMGARRPGVTEAMHALTGHGLVRARRGLITVVDRRGLQSLAGRFYGAPEAEYDRLLG